MADVFGLFHTSNNPTGLAGTVGGAITTTGYVGSLGELFVHVDAPPSGTVNPVFQYRKVHLKNISSSVVTGIYVWLDGVEHTGQIHLGIERATNQTISAPTGSAQAPAGVSFSNPFNYSGGTFLGTLTGQESTGIWLRQTLSGIHSPDPYATFILSCGGIIT